VRTSVARLGTAVWIFILAAIGGVQVFRGAYVDAAIFGVVVVALLADAAGWLPRSESARRLLPPALLIAVLLAAAGILVFTPRHGVPAAIVVGLVGLAALALSWPNPRDVPGPLTRATIRAGIAWSLAGVVACLWELAMYILGTFSPGGRTTYPALSDLINPLIDVPVVKLLFVTGWLLAGTFLLRRASSR
jgi:hypothetical protein